MKVGIEDTQAGLRTLYVEKDGTRRYVHSRYDPGREGAAFHHEHTCSALTIIIGLGLGHHIRPILKNDRVKKVVILEPDEQLYMATSGTPEIGSLLSDPRVSLFHGEEIDAFIECIGARYDYLLMGNLSVLSYPPLKKLFPSRYEEVERSIRFRLDLLVDEGMTIGKFARTWLRNFAANLKTLDACEFVDCLYGAFSGSVVVTGAGPSLDGALESLKALRKGYFLLATDASVRPLLLSGITPDLLVTMDPQRIVSFHFRGLPQAQLGGIPAVLSFLSCPEVFSLFTKRYLFFNRYPLNRLFDPSFQEGDAPEGDAAGGDARIHGGAAPPEEQVLNYQSVGSLALSIAVRMGFSDIILAGFDFAYPGLRVYAKDTFFHDYGILSWSRFSPFPSKEAEFIRRNDASRKGSGDGRPATGEPAESGRTSRTDSAGEVGLPAPDRQRAGLLCGRKLSDYRAELQGVIREAGDGIAGKCKAVTLHRMGKAGMPIEGVRSVEPSDLGRILEKGLRRDKPPLNGRIVNGFAASGGAFRGMGRVKGGWGTVRHILRPEIRELDASIRSAVALTLALRSRIFKGIESGQRGFRIAENYLEAKLRSIFPETNPSHLKFENHGTDI